jgi:putative ABC transport system permease protein
MRRAWLRLLAVFQSTRAEAELAREIASHLQLLEDQFAARGMSRDEARFAARRAFGGQVEQVKERQRDARAFRWLDESWLDLKLGARMLVKYPGLTVIALLALSVAIGGGASYLEFANDFLRPTLPIADADRIVRIQNLDLATGEEDARALYDFQAWKDNLTSVEHLGAAVTLERNLITDDGRSEPVRGVEISAAAFRLFPTVPIYGRPLIAEDEQPAAPAVAVIGHALWQSRFAGDPGVVGRTIRLGRMSHTIVGIMPPSFGFPVNHSLWVPFRLNAAGARRTEGPALRVFGRLTPGTPLAAAQAQLESIAAGLEAAPAVRLQPRIAPYLGAMFSSSEDRLQVIALWSMNLFFIGLLGVCGANVATLVFARTAMREGEITVRTALGASRARIVAQLFAEALVLSSLAAAIGLWGASYASTWGKNSFLAAAADGAASPFWWNDDLSLVTCVYAGVLALLAAAVVGIVPAMKATGAQMQARLTHAAARGSSMKFGGVWTAVIVTQIALTVIFVMTGVTLGWDAYASRHALRDAGFPRADYLSVRLAMDGDASPRFAATYRELERRASAEPGILGVTYGTALPGMGHRLFDLEFQGIETPLSPIGLRSVKAAAVDADFFATFNAPIVAGRGFTPADVELERPVAIVDQTFVQQVLKGGNPIGQYVRQAQGADVPEPGPWYEIVGVVADLTRAPQKWYRDAVLYFPGTPGLSSRLHMAIHVGGNASAFAPRLRALAAEVDPTLRLYEVMRLDQLDDVEQLGLSFFIRVIAVVSAVTLILATAGVYAMLSFNVTRRTREIGIRVAVGADARRVLTGIFSRSFAQVAIGIVVGAIPGGVLVATSAPEGFRDSGPVVAGIALTGVAAFILTITLIACIVPARRALRIHPTDALRADS